MPGRIRRKVSELVARYQLHPELKDLYVEGPRDLHFFSDFFSPMGLTSPAVYLIDAVEIDEPISPELGGGGAKGRLLSLASALGETNPAISTAALCLTDRDFFGVALEEPDSSKLVLTDFASLEAYAVTLDNLRRLGRIVLLREISDPALLDIIAVTKRIFLLRAAKFRLSWQSPWIDNFTKEMSLDEDGRVCFDEPTYIQKISNKSNGAIAPDTLAGARSVIEEKCDGEDRCYLNGHDFVFALAWYARMIGVDRELREPRALQGALLSSLDQVAASQYPLFLKLTWWAAF